MNSARILLSMFFAVAFLIFASFLFWNAYGGTTCSRNIPASLQIIGKIHYRCPQDGQPKDFTKCCDNPSFGYCCPNTNVKSSYGLDIFFMFCFGFILCMIWKCIFRKNEQSELIDNISTGQHASNDFTINMDIPEKPNDPVVQNKYQPQTNNPSAAGPFFVVNNDIQLPNDSPPPYQERVEQQNQPKYPHQYPYQN